MKDSVPGRPDLLVVEGDRSNGWFAMRTNSDFAIVFVWIERDNVNIMMMSDVKFYTTMGWRFLHGNWRSQY